MPAYDNNAVAAKLELFADLLEITGADKYRYLSYRKAAGSIRAWPEQVAALANEGHLTELPGVGNKMAAAVEQVIERGSFDQLDELSDRIPASLASVMAVPGVGPKRAALLHEKLGVSDVEELEQALSDGRVERLGGFGAKTAARIGAALDSYRRHTERVPIGEALPVAEQLVRDLESAEGVERAQVAGSVRRRAETVGNIDLVVASSDPPAAIASLRALAAVERIIGEARDSIDLELHDGFEVRAHVAAPDRFAAALRYWTGSIDHNRALEQRARDCGFVLGADGLEEKGLLQRSGEESEIFSALGLPFMPPEVREGSETLALAAAGALPELVELDDIRGDLQSHSTYTDGKTTLEQNQALATELGYEYLAVTDHAYALRMVGGLDLDDLERQWSEIEDLNSCGRTSTRLLKGIELNIAADGSLDYDDDVLARFDIVLASLHSGWDEDAATVTARAIAAIEHPLVDVIAHPTGRVLGRRDALRLDMHEVLAAAGETGTIMEINSYPDRLDLSAEHLVLARSFGVRFSLGTDAHAAAQLRYMPYGVAQARRGLVSAKELLNAQPWETARTWLKRHRLLG